MRGALFVTFGLSCVVSILVRPVVPRRGRPCVVPIGCHPSDQAHRPALKCDKGAMRQETRLDRVILSGVEGCAIRVVCALSTSECAAAWDYPAALTAILRRQMYRATSSNSIPARTTTTHIIVHSGGGGSSTPMSICPLRKPSGVSISR